MNTLPPNEPLDEQEREFARILHALPGGDPPPALDAAILRAATNAAAASSKRPVRRALASAGALWGIGTAAAAVLALGVVWQMRFGIHDESIQRERAPSAHVVSDVAEDDSVQVEFPAQVQNAPMSPPPPMDAAKPAEPAESRLRRQAQPTRAAPAAAPAAAAPEPFAADQAAAASSSELQAEQAAKLRDEERASAAAAEEGARAKQADEMKERNELAAKSATYANAAPPPPPPAAYRPAAVGGGFVAAQSPPKPQAGAAAAEAPAPALARADTGALDAVGAASGQVAKTEAAPVPKKPATWLADIRKLRDQGKTQEARAALVEFRKKYPKWVIPTDLAPLLSQ